MAAIGSLCFDACISCKLAFILAQHRLRRPSGTAEGATDACEPQDSPLPDSPAVMLRGSCCNCFNFQARLLGRASGYATESLTPKAYRVQ
ncbi:unnamed protein product [Diplocarpon coronariae]